MEIARWSCRPFPPTRRAKAPLRRDGGRTVFDLDGELRGKSQEGQHVAVPNFKDADTASLPFLESVPTKQD